MAPSKSSEPPSRIPGQGRSATSAPPAPTATRAAPRRSSEKLCEVAQHNGKLYRKVAQNKRQLYTKVGQNNRQLYPNVARNKGQLYPKVARLKVAPDYRPLAFEVGPIRALQGPLAFVGALLAWALGCFGVEDEKILHAGSSKTGGFQKPRVLLGSSCLCGLLGP